MGTTSLVGRDAQLDQLDTQLRCALRGDAVTCFVTGEPGAGKSSLAMEFVRRAQASVPQLLVATAICDAYTGVSDAYLPFRELLLQLTGDVDRSLAAGRTSREGATRLQGFARFAGRALLDNGPDLVGMFVPGGALLARIGGMAAQGHPWAQKLQQKLDGTSPSQATVRTLQQENVFEQYTQVLHAMAAERPLLLLLDDLQWADSASIGLLFHLSRRLVASPLLILGTYRGEEVARTIDGRPHPLQGVVAELTRVHGEIVFDLDSARARTFIDALVDARPNGLDERFRESLARHTAGNPLFAVELLASLEASGALVTSADGRLEQVRPVQWHELPARVTGVIESRVMRLTATQKEVLATASVQGEEFVADAVAEVLRLERRDVIRELSGSMQKELRLVTAIGLQELANGTRLARYRFRHNLVQDFLYRRLDEIERADLHGATGLALERIHGPFAATEAAVALALHFTAAADWKRAVHYRLQAAKAAAGAFAHGQAVEHYEQALALATRYGAAATTGHAEDLAAVRESLGDELVLVRRWSDAEAAFRASLAEVAADRVANARLLRKLARVEERQSRYAEAAARLEAAEAVLGTTDTARDCADWWHEHLEILLAVSFLHYWQGDLAGMAAADARLESVIETRGTAIQRAQYHAGHARNLLRQTRYWPDDAAIASAERAVATVAGSPDEPLQAEITFLLGFVRLWAEQLAEADAALERCLDVSRRFGDLTHQLRCLVYRSVVQRRLGDVVRVEQLTDEARALMRQMGTNEYAPVVLAQDAWLAWRRDDATAARSALRDALPAAGARPSRFPFQWLSLWVAVAVNTADGRLPEAIQAAVAMLQPPLARQRENVEEQLRRIEAARHGDDATARPAVEQAIALARAAGYL